MSLRPSSHCGLACWLSATRQRPAAHDTESDDDDFRDAAGTAGSAAKKPPAFAQVPPKSGAKRRGKEKHHAHDSDDDFKAAPSKKGKKEAAKAPGQRGIGSFFAKGAAKPTGRGSGPAENDRTVATAGGGTSEAKEDLVLSDKGVIPHYIASQLKAHQVGRGAWSCATSPLFIYAEPQTRCSDMSAQ